MHRAFRIKNLIIILLTQWAVWYMVFDKNSDVVRIPSAMSYLEIIILGIITTMLAIGAYLINDVYRNNFIRWIWIEGKKVGVVIFYSLFKSHTIVDTIFKAIGKIHYAIGRLIWMLNTNWLKKIFETVQSC